jgi:hypothetical protein
MGRGPRAQAVHGGPTTSGSQGSCQSCACGGTPALKTRRRGLKTEWTMRGFSPWALEGGAGGGVRPATGRMDDVG